MTPAISVVIATHNDASVIGRTLDVVQQIAVDLDIIVADAGSTDDTVAIAQWCGARVLSSSGTTEASMHAGAAAARADVLWFLSADAIPPKDACERILETLADHLVAGGRLCGLFVRRSVYERAGGFAEGSERKLVKHVRQYGRLVHIRDRGRVSAAPS